MDVRIGVTQAPRELTDAVAATEGSDAVAYVSGLTAAFTDIADRIYERLPLFLLYIIGVTFIVLAMAFRSIVISLTAAITTILSAFVGFGVLTLVVQEGHLLSLTGLDRTGPIETFVPPIAFAILFGLSMDYQVFLLSRVREEIEKMQGELKYWDSQVQFATVTISLSEKDMEEPAAFLLKERAQLALYAPEVEKVYNDIKALASPKVQITNARLDRDYSGRVSARVSMLIAPEESNAVIGRVKGFGRVENFQVQTERIAQGGSGMSESAKTKRDKVELNVTISREEQEQAFQQTSLRIRTSSVDEKSKQLRELTEKQNGRVRSSTFSRDPDGREMASVSLRVPMKNYLALMQSLNSLGKVEDVSVHRQDRTGAQIDEASAPARSAASPFASRSPAAESAMPTSTTAPCDASPVRSASRPAAARTRSPAGRDRRRGAAGAARRRRR